MCKLPMLALLRRCRASRRSQTHHVRLCRGGRGSVCRPQIQAVRPRPLGADEDELEKRKSLNAEKDLAVSAGRRTTHRVRWWS